MKRLSIVLLSMAVLLLPAAMVSAQSSVSRADMNLTARSVSNADMNLRPGVQPRPNTSQPSDDAGSKNPFSSPEDVFTFPSALSIVVGSVGFIDAEQVGFFWSVARGDSVTQTFAGPPTINQYSLDVDVISNGLNNGAFVNWDVLINSVVVDNFTVNEGFLGTVSRSAGFAAMGGPNYTVELRVTNEVAGGQGAHTLRYAGIGFNQVELTGPGGTRVCLDSFCDVFFCGRDNGNNISCEWDWTCTGTDNEEMIGTIVGQTVTIGGLLEAIGLTESGVFDASTRTVDLWIWNGIGSTSLLASDTWTLNCPIGPREHLLSVHETIATPDE